MTFYKKLNSGLNCLMGCVLVVLIGTTLYTYWDYRARPGLYISYSAPWYTGPLLHAAVTAAVIAAALLIKLAIRKKLK